MRLLLPLILFAFTACNSSEPSNFVGGDSADKAEKSTAAQYVALAPPPQSEAYSAVEQMTKFKPAQVSNPTVDEVDKIPSQIIKNAHVRFQVADLSKSTPAAQQVVNQMGGYVASSNETRGNGELSANLSIRVPFSQFDRLLDELTKQSVFLNTKNITAEDVTEEFIDIQARLKTKKEAEQRYLEILRQAKTVKEILEVETQLRVIREETEAQEGRLKLLKDRVKYSTITLEMYQPLEYQPEPAIGFFSKLASGVSKGWVALLDFTVGLVSLWPFWLMLAGLVYGIRRWRRISKTNLTAGV